MSQEVDNKNKPQAKRGERPGLLKVVFDYPFYLAVPNFYFPVAIKTEDIYSLLKVETREGAQVYDKGKLLRERVIEEKKYIQVEPRGDISTENTELVATGEDGNPVFHYVAGKDGYAAYPWHYSEIEIIFPVSDVYSAWSGRDNSAFVTAAVAKIFNRFLLHYRNVSNDVHNRLLSGEMDLTFYTSLYISEFSPEDQRLPTVVVLNPAKIEERTFTPFPWGGNKPNPKAFPVVKASIIPPLMNNAKKRDLDPALIATLIHGTGGAFEVKIFNEILLSGLERYAMEKDHRIAIIDFDTAVEMTVMHYLMLSLIKEGRTDAEIGLLFDEENEAARKLSNKGGGYLTTKQRMTRLNEFINKYRTEKGLQAVSLFGLEYQGWNKDVRKKRNLSVHMWEHFKKEDTEKAFSSAQTFIRFIQKLGGETFETVEK